MKTAFKLALSLMMTLTTASIASAKPAPENRDHALWDAVVNLEKRFNATAVGEAGLVEGAMAGSISLGLGVVGLLARDKAKYERLTSLGAPVALAGVLVMLVGQYVQAFERHPSFDPRVIPHSLTENHLEAKEMWALYQFMRFSLDEQYERASKDPELRQFLIDLDNWLHGDLTTTPPPPMPTQKVSGPAPR